MFWVYVMIWCLMISFVIFCWVFDVKFCLVLIFVLCLIFVVMNGFYGECWNIDGDVFCFICFWIVVVNLFFWVSDYCLVGCDFLFVFVKFDE